MLEEIHCKIVNKDHGQRIVVVQGLKGIGKTRLAAEYARLHKEDYSAVFWLDATEEASLREGFRKAADRIVHDHSSAPCIECALDAYDLNTTVQGVKRWLEIPGNDRWLLVYDNYDNQVSNQARYNIRQYLPSADHGTVLITTQSPKVAVGQELIQLGKLKEAEDGIDMLVCLSERESLRNGTSRATLLANTNDWTQCGC